MSAFQDQAVVLRAWEYSETSQTVVLFCRTRGLVRGLAKGSRRERSRFDGGFEPLTLGQVGGLIAPGSELATVTDWSIGRIFRGVRRYLTAYFAGMHLADLVHRAILDHDPHERLFDALVEGLARLDEPGTAAGVVLRFQWRLLVEIGYRPRLESVAVRPGARASPSVLLFDPHAGSIVGAAPPKRTSSAIGGWRVRAGTIRTLQRLAAAEEGADAVPRASSADILAASRFLSAYLQYILDRDLPSREPLFRALASAAKPPRTPNTR